MSANRADDIIMFTKDEQTLREMLETLEEYTNENKLEINVRTYIST